MIAPQSCRRSLALAAALASIVALCAPAWAQDPLDDIQLRPRKAKPDTAATNPAAAPATAPAPTPGTAPAAPATAPALDTPAAPALDERAPQAAPEVPAEDAIPAPAASKARPQRVINLEQVEVNTSDYVLEPDPIGGAVVLNLGKIEREPERKWSLQLSLGASEASLDESIARVRTMERLGRDIFGQLAENAGPGFELPWTDEGTTEPSSASRIRGDVRYKPIPVLTLEAEVGRSAAQSAFSQPGFRYDETSEVIDASVGALVTLPWRLWRFGFYAGGGVGLLRGTLTSQLFVPSFSGTPEFSVSRATGSSQQFNLKGGGEVYLTRFISFTVEGEYRKAEIDELEYDDDAEIKAAGEESVPLAWIGYEADFIQQFFQPIADPDQPVKLDFSGFLLTGGLRYHF